MLFGLPGGTIVVLVLPLLIEDYPTYLLVEETFAPLAECLFFYAMYIAGRATADAHKSRRATWRDMAAVTVANLASFGLGMLVWNSPLAD